MKLTFTMTAMLLAFVCTNAFAQNPPFAPGSFCTSTESYYGHSLQALKDIQTADTQSGLAGYVVGDPFTGFAYQWQHTGTNLTVNGVPIDAAYVALQEAIESNTKGKAGPFTTNTVNSTDMGTGGELATETMALNLNFEFSVVGLTPPFFNALNLTNMKYLVLDGRRLTSAQATALNGQSVDDVDSNANEALATGQLFYGLTSKQLAKFVEILNLSFSEEYRDAHRVKHACGLPSAFAQLFMYQSYLTSSAFTGRKPTENSAADFGFRPASGHFSGQLSSVANLGCSPTDFSAFVSGDIALIERGLCLFSDKVNNAINAGAIAVIVYNHPGGEDLVEMSGAGLVTIPSVFVQNSTGVALVTALGSGPVTVLVKQ